MHGTLVGQYRITGSIGQGGMGAVYSAEHSLLGRTAAVKVLLPELSQNQEVVTRFFNEARAATAIRHPSIVEIYDFGYHTDGAAYIVMEFLQGESLATRMARGRMDLESALLIVRQMAGALAAAHRKGIVHRDLKPDNVFLVPDPEVPGGERIKLLDFGIAKLTDDRTPSQKTRTGTVMGTPTYMAPEQCRGVSVDPRADLYSLGCILFEMLAGRPPFVGEGFGDVLAAHIHVPPPTLSSLVPAAGPEIDLLLQRMLAKDPAQRIQTAEEVVHAVDAARGGPTYRTGPKVAGGPMPTSPMIMPPTTLSGAAQALDAPPPATRARSRWPLVVGAGVATAAAVVAAVVLGGSRGGDRGAATSAEPALAAAAAAVPTPAPPAPVAPAPVPTPPPPTPTPAAAAEPAPAPPATPTQVEVVLESTPKGATVWLDGARLGVTPFRGAIPYQAGEVTLTVRLAGHVDASVVVRADAASVQHVKLPRKRATTGGGAGTASRDDSVNPFGN